MHLESNPISSHPPTRLPGERFLLDAQPLACPRGRGERAPVSVSRDPARQNVVRIAGLKRANFADRESARVSTEMLEHRDVHINRDDLADTAELAGSAAQSQRMNEKPFARIRKSKKRQQKPHASNPVQLSKPFWPCHQLGSNQQRISPCPDHPLCVLAAMHSAFCD